MANAWDAGSAVLLAQAGFEAIGTTSAGIAYSHALPDGEGALGFDQALRTTGEMAAAVDIPLSMDSENLYAHDPQDVFDNMRRIVETGAVGASIEDYRGDPADPFYDIELAVDRVGAAREAVNDLDYPFVLTARSECYLYRHPDPFAESIRRLNRYREAGADCLYAPGIRDIQVISDLVSAVDGAVNVVMGLSGSPLTLAQLQSAGVTRVSIGGSLSRTALGLVRRAAREMLEQGSFGFASEQIADAELSQLFSTNASRED
ncbi:MAG: isocitrate lyase/phosphoenolpyruvate mutase family protein [Gammaproteobacteria bacterium]|nr:isocitrate lyase/phosphoenolpyruvate mutase family protein [Gammaproteobacteria bacterium]